ncbi:MAG: hypothetical protein H7A43_05930 [Verrucomicrobia bacterium]|nr:hypothetical protein [Verrucomicrobiota bacterium]
MKIKRGCLIAALVSVLLLGGLLLTPVVYRWLHPIAHQLPYKWDSYVRPDLQFEMEPMTNVVAMVNAAIREASDGALPEAITVDSTPTQIIKVNSIPQLDVHMDRLIADFRLHEEEMKRRGAEGFESAPFTGWLGGHHSLWCSLVGPNMAGLHWEPRADALHVSRSPRAMECRAYGVGDELIRTTEEWIAEGRTHAEHDWDPVCFVFVKMAGMRSWSIMVPSGPNSASGEFRLSKVTRYLPDRKVILALETPVRHKEAEALLKQKGLWVETEEAQLTNSQVFSEAALSGASSEKP